MDFLASVGVENVEKVLLWRDENVDYLGGDDGGGAGGYWWWW